MINLESYQPEGTKTFVFGDVPLGRSGSLDTHRKDEASVKPSEI